ncbi:MAG: hypothetical protein MJ177_11170 [Clostridia bacterium]|nr:hypothetical protein [Clostridia bacterium]
MGRYKSFVALISVTDTETQQVMRLYDWKEKRFDGDGQIYYEACIEKDGKKLPVITARQDEMGMTASATLSMKIIEHYRPQYLIMVGIAAGVVLPDVENQIYGDVVLADVVWNYSSGKFVSPEKADIRFGDIGFIPRPTAISIKEELVPYIRAAAESDENETHVYIGPMASGSAVVANQEVLNKQIRHSYHNTAGLDMEAYAVMYAAEHATEPKPSPIIAKSVCDYADSRKSDQYQRFAAFTSCQVAKLLSEEYLPVDE